MKRLLIIGLILLCSNYYSKSQVLEQDSLALISLFNTTNGENWHYSNHWLEEGVPIDLWYGIEIENNRVTQINLPGNNLVGSLPAEIGNLDSLSILSIGGNSIYSISSNIGNLLTLDTLTLWACPIEYLPIEIGNLSDLNLIDFSHTEITILPEEIGGLISLEYLIGSEGVLESIPETIGNLTSLKEVYLPLNNISNLPASICNCSNLTKLTLNANSIPEIPPEIGNLNNLVHLILGGNDINTIPDEVYSLSNLEYLNFAANDLDTISSLIGNLINLENFQFFSNKFTYIPEEIGNCQSLGYINGYGNDIDSLPLSLLNLPNVGTLGLHYNSLTFDDIEPLVSINGFIYDSQDSIGVKIDTTIYLDSTYYVEINTGGEYNTYQWKKNNEIIVGATTHYLEFPNVTYADSGTYNCEITNSQALGLKLQSRTIKLAIKEFMSIGEFAYPQPIYYNIYPNPANNKVTIDLLDGIYPSKFEILLFDLSGNLIKNLKTANIFPIEIVISDLDNGVYFIQFNDIEKKFISIREKIVKVSY